jgi:MFS family permease
MQLALHYTPSQAGLILLPAGLVLAGVIPLAGHLTDRFPPNFLVAGGLALLALSFALMALGSSAGSYFLLMTWAIIGRIGLGFVLPALSLGSLRGLTPELIAQGSSTINFVRQLGGAIGISLVGIVLEWRLAARTADTAGRLRAFDDTFLLVAGLCALAIVAAWRMREAPQPQ